MKNGITRIAFTAALLLSGNLLMAQSETSGSSYFTYGLMAIVAFIIFAVVIQVSDNLMAIEAKQSGADKSGANFSIFPKWNEIFKPKMPKYAAGKDVTLLSAGHDILLEGAPEDSAIHAGSATHYAVNPKNFLGLSPIPKVEVEVGDKVKAGDHLFFDKKNPAIKFVAPVSGEIVEVKRGEKRSIAEIIIKADATQAYRDLTVPALDAPREDLVQFLLDCGGWTLIQQRPFNIVPGVEDVPNNIFVSTFDSAPLAPDNNIIIAGKEADFQKGLDVLNKLTPGKVHLGVSAAATTAPAAAFTEAEGVEVNWFHGKHPAGNVGIQIHHTAPIVGNAKVWTLSVQEVITLGHIFNKGHFHAERTVVLTGEQFETPKYVSTHIGANIGELVAGNVVTAEGEKARFVSGDVLSGTAKTTEEFLDYRDDQVTVLKEGDYNELFGWLIPIAPRPSISNTFPNFLFPDLKFSADTNAHGEHRAFVVSGQYESVLPMDIYPQHLMKSIMIKDFERMEGLGINELVEEDIALCEFVCTSKQPLQSILREGLELMREQG